MKPPLFFTCMNDFSPISFVDSQKNEYLVPKCVFCEKEVSLNDLSKLYP